VQTRGFFLGTEEDEDFKLIMVDIDDISVAFNVHLLVKKGKKDKEGNLFCSLYQPGVIILLFTIVDSNIVNKFKTFWLYLIKPLRLNVNISSNHFLLQAFLPFCPISDAMH